MNDEPSLKKTRLYLYGIFPYPGPQTLDCTGLDQKPIYSHHLDNFTFLYSEATQDKYLASRRHLLSHEKVLEHAMTQGYRTLLPLRFGMVVKSWDTVSEQLTQPYATQLKDLFEKLNGLREVSIKVFWDNNNELQALMATNQALKQQRDALEGKALSMDEVIQIGQRIEANLETRKQDIIQVFCEKLNPLAVEVSESELLTDNMIYSAAYLIPWEAETKFSEVVEQIDQAFDGRLRIRYNNFTAPYTFAQLN